MDRKTFLASLALMPLIYKTTGLKILESKTSEFANSPKMPVLFIGHGHPMNALLDNSFTQKLRTIGASMEKPSAVMMVSAHWETRGTYVSLNSHPGTIYDFGNFDPRLFEIKYAPAGHPALAREVAALGQKYGIATDQTMGLDHGAWTVLKYMFPEADIPVFQLSIDYTQPPAYHFALAAELKKIREKGVLVIGSGNIVHNLGILDWNNIEAKPFDWAVEFDELVKARLSNLDFNSLVHYHQFGTLAKMAVPSNDHYLPMLYSLGLADKNERVSYFYEGIQHGSISMRCFKIS